MEWQKEFADKFGILLEWGHGDEFRAQPFIDFISHVHDTAYQEGRASIMPRTDESEKDAGKGQE